MCFLQGYELSNPWPLPLIPFSIYPRVYPYPCHAVGITLFYCYFHHTRPKTLLGPSFLLFLSSHQARDASQAWDFFLFNTTRARDASRALVFPLFFSLQPRPETCLGLGFLFLFLLFYFYLFTRARDVSRAVLFFFPITTNARDATRTMTTTTWQRLGAPPCTYEIQYAK